jgi:TrmH family RNA methyltransferase
VCRNPDAALAPIRRLRDHRSAREACGLHFIEGVRNFVRCVDHGIKFDTLIGSKQLLQSTVGQMLVRRLRKEGVPCVSLTPEQFRSVSTLTRASGVAAIVRTHWSRLRDTPAGRGLCWISLQRVRSAGNIGTLLRTGHAVGAAGLIVAGADVDPFDPVAVRASVGSVFALRLVRASAHEFSHWARRQRRHVVGASPNAPTEYHQVTFRRPTVIVLGDERCGLSSQQLAFCETTVRIPVARDCDSLNLGVAGSLLLYEVLRSTGTPHAAMSGFPAREP